MEAKQRIRERIWRELEERGITTFPKPVEGRIPNFQGSELAAERLCSQMVYRRAETVFVNPDSPQLPVRENVLRDRKRLIMATPRLRQGFVEISGDVPKSAASIRGALRFGRRIKPWQVQVDLLVEGSVAVDRFGGRLGKGGGFGDLEFAILKEAGAITDETPVATTVHELQILDRVPMTEHDAPVDLVVTPRSVMEVERTYPKPKGILWNILGTRMLEEIPLLRELKNRRLS
ncbi:MAG: 5-formyltetrahydrofolate cyclo-ligase [Candidatus Hadarchaeales archaeon]